METLEALCREMLEQAKTLNVSVTGALTTPENMLLGFSNDVVTANEQMSNIKTLVKAKGDVGEFLCDISLNEHEHLFSGEDMTVDLSNKALTFTQTNPQVFDTQH